MDTSQFKKLYEELEKERKSAHKFFLIFVLLGIVFFLLGIISFFFAENDVLMILGLVAFFAGIILIAIGFGKKSYFKKNVQKTVEVKVAETLFPGAKYDAKDGLDYESVMKPGFFARPDRFYSTNLMEGTYKGIPFKKSSYDLQKKHTSTDSKGHTTVTYVTYASGTMFCFHFERDFKQIVKVLEKEGVLSFGMGEKGLTKVETEFIQFNKKFKVLTSDETLVFYLLTPQIQENVIKLESVYKGGFYLAYMGDELYVAINDNGESMNIPFSKPINEETMKPVIVFAGAPAFFVDTLNLDSNKYKANAGTDIKQ